MSDSVYDERNPFERDNYEGVTVKAYWHDERREVKFVLRQPGYPKKTLYLPSVLAGLMLTELERLRDQLQQ